MQFSVKATSRYLLAVLYLAPNTLSGYNVCSDATPGCIAVCSNESGLGRMHRVQAARLAKTRRFFESPTVFADDLALDIERLVGRAARLGLTLDIRLNGTSDLPWERIRTSRAPSLMARFPEVRFRDYTKIPIRMRTYLAGGFPRNYDLCFSRSETNLFLCYEVLASRGNVAVVFGVRPDDPLPRTWQGYRVRDILKTDFRVVDPREGVVLGLRPKGNALRDRTGFVVRL